MATAYQAGPLPVRKKTRARPTASAGAGRALDDDELQKMLPLPEAAFHILVALADHDRHGYALMQEVADLTEGRMRLRPGTLYAAIQRMLEQGLIVEVSSRGGNERRRT